ncbi:hypothetical protein [Gimesia fumaroli]|uniref:HD domain-containing protein n=1 Tax=Gimesia fumaroli TaxID=2527976 RepID=A0A518IA44_9PLAN|nr:hypothetical protein [Gimesia fumaroli]QDV50013.1 hypothetical protein Enr17x_20390 [Gimesia fumaroli]
MKFLLPILCLIPISAFAEEWMPPANPDLQSILSEAQADARAKRYELALTKQVWFHENALKHNRAFSGVRLSFALASWHDLGKVYPPALDRLKEARDQASNNVLDGKDLFKSFQDFSSINRILNEDSLTVNTFIQLELQDKAAAKKVFRLAKPSLIRGKEYKICGKYLEPKRSYALMLQLRKSNQRLAKNPQFGPNILEFSNKKFTNDIATLIALLVVNDRKMEAKEIAKSAKTEWDNAAFHAAIDKALEGNVPTPWP